MRIHPNRSDPADREHRAADRPGARPEVVGRVLGVDPALDRVARERDVLLTQAERPALGNGDLLGDDVQPGDRLGDRVLDLDARVDLEEVELAAVGVDQELDRARAPVPEMTAEGDRRRPQPVPQVLVESGGRRLLDQLLIAPLDGAVPIAQVDDPLPVAQDLHLNMAPALDVALQVHPSVPERRPRLRARHRHRVGQLARLPHHPKPPPATAPGRLHQHRKPNPGRKPRQVGSGRTTCDASPTSLAGTRRSRPRRLRAGLYMGLVAHRAR